MLISSAACDMVPLDPHTTVSSTDMEADRWNQSAQQGTQEINIPRIVGLRKIWRQHFLFIEVVFAVQAAGEVSIFFLLYRYSCILK